ncbi:MAG: hypothetical protein HQ578_03195 [Chloroflexi bacterium]|nr:hypothetical protein [Chloroflexota bacterium]
MAIKADERPIGLTLQRWAPRLMIAYQLALEKASSLDQDEVRNALASLDATLFYGRMKFDEKGRDSYNSMIAFQIQHGNIVTVWPKDAAVGTALYPTPPWDSR